MISVLVANRGEIARRVFATCRRLGIGTVAVYTDPDADAPHVAEADARVRLEKTNGYLDIGALLTAAQGRGRRRHSPRLRIPLGERRIRRCRTECRD